MHVGIPCVAAFLSMLFNCSTESIVVIIAIFILKYIL